MYLYSVVNTIIHVWTYLDFWCGWSVAYPLLFSRQAFSILPCRRRVQLKIACCPLGAKIEKISHVVSGRAIAVVAVSTPPSASDKGGCTWQLQNDCKVAMANVLSFEKSGLL